MSQNFTVVKRRNYLQRLGDSLVGVLIGLALIIASVMMLFWNEGRAVEASRGLASAEGVVTALPRAVVQPAQEGDLVHVSGPVTSSAPVIDPDTGATFASALLIERKVEMYQWIQTASSRTEEKLGGTQETTTTYSYAPGWSESQQDSASFAQPAGHTNPDFPFRSMTTTASDATLGDFRVSAALLEQADALTPVQPSAAPAGWTQTPEGLYRGAGNSAAPQVGDLRVTYRQMPAGTVLSLLGKQSGRDLVGWSPQGSQYTLLTARTGVVPAADMLAEQKSGEATLTWVLRAVGYVMAIIGFQMLLGPLSALANVVPLVASLLGSVSGLIGFALATVTATGTIAVAWFAVRPLLSLCLVGVGVGLWLAVRMQSRRGRPAGTSAPTIGAGH